MADFNSGRRCSGYDDSEHPSSTKPYIRCGNLYGVPVSTDKVEGTQVSIGSPYQQSLYACASSVKASIKVVELTFNGTTGLSNLTASRLTDKDYTNQPLPLWGVERIDNSTEFTIADIDVLWGLVSDAYENDESIETRRGEDFYLPAAYQGHTLTLSLDNLAAATIFTAVWNNVYNFAAWIAGTSIDSTPSYSGESQYALFLKWRELSQSPDGASTILNLIWTDLVASAVVGTKTGFEQTNLDESVWKRAVHKHRTIIIYSNFLFAIPAFVAAFLWTLLLVIALSLLCFGQLPWRTLNHYMNQTSLGRAVHHAAYPYFPLAAASTKDWVKGAGNDILEMPQLEKKMQPNLLMAPVTNTSV
jgi:hypothetical protein